MRRDNINNPLPCEFAMLLCYFDNNIIHNVNNNAARFLCQLVLEAWEVDNDGIVVVLQDSGVAPNLATSGSIVLLV